MSAHAAGAWWWSVRWWRSWGSVKATALLAVAWLRAERRRLGQRLEAAREARQHLQTSFARFARTTALAVHSHARGRLAKLVRYLFRALDGGKPPAVRGLAWRREHKRPAGNGPRWVG